jgi:hypothetical protein
MTMADKSMENDYDMAFESTIAAYFINPFGKVVSTNGRSHISMIIAEPEKFGFTKDYIQDAYDKYKEKLGVEGTAREDLIKGLGFNAVRIPFCPATLRNVVITSYVNPTKNPDLTGLKSLDVMDKVLAQLNDEKMYILLDHHRPDCETISELWYTADYSEAEWIEDLKFVAERYQHLGYFMGIDIKNEPHGRATWGTGNLATDWNKAAERAAQAVLTANPDILVFVEALNSILLLLSFRR